MSLPSPAVTKTSSVAAVATEIDLKRICHSLQIWTDSGASDIYVRFDGVDPTVGDTGSIKIQGGASWASPSNANLGVDSFKYIGSGTNGKLSVFGV